MHSHRVNQYNKSVVQKPTHYTTTRS